MSDMNPRDYVVWLQGMYEMIGDRQPTEAEWAMLRSAHKLQFGKVIVQDMTDAIDKDAKLTLMQAQKAAYDTTMRKVGQAVGQAYTPGTITY